MNKNEYRELVKRCINKNIVTSMTSLELPFNQTRKAKPKATSKDDFSPKEMKEIFNSLINS